MADDRVEHDERGVDAAERFSRNLQTGEEGAVFSRLEFHASFEGSVGVRFQGDRERRKRGVVIFALEPERSGELLPVGAEPGADGQFDRVAGGVDLVGAVRDDGVLLRLLCRFAVDPGEAEVVEVEGVAGAAVRNAVRQNPDVIIVGVGFDLEPFGEAFPFGAGAEAEAGQHGVVAVAAEIGEGAEVDVEALLRLHDAGFIRTDFRIEGDLHFAVAREQKVGEFELVVGNAGVAGNHQTAAGVAAGNGPGEVDLFRIGVHGGDRRPVDVEPVGGNAGAGQPQLHGSIEVDRFPCGQQCDG